MLKNRLEQSEATQTDDQIVFVDALEISNWDRELFEELRAGQLSAVHVTCAVWEEATPALQNIGRWNLRFQENADLLVKVRTIDDIDAARKSRRTGVILGFQNASPIEDKFSFVELFYDVGVRIMQLTYNNQNLIGGSCYEATDSGLTRFGRLIVREMNRVGMLVDLSHVGEQTSLDAIEASQRPVAITHANPTFFLDHPRNKSEKVLRALAGSGGVIGLSPIPFLIPNGNQLSFDRWAEMAARTVELIGVDHVGIGTDSVRKCTADDIRWQRMGRWTPVMDPDPGAAVLGIDPLQWPHWPEWFETPADFPKLASSLRQHGFSVAEVRAVMGGNWMRLFADAFTPQRGHKSA